jgi:SAM-dependent methyltransferase
METRTPSALGGLPIRDVKHFFNRGPAGAFDTLYRQVNRQVLAPFFRSCLETDGLVLDAGCGRGDLAAHLNLSHSFCIDVAFEPLRQGRRGGIAGPPVQSDLSHLPFETDTFDAVLCANALHYSGFSGLRELHRVTKPSGRLLLAFLERSDYTRWAIEWAICWGIFPPFFRDAPLIDISDFHRLNVIVEDSVTVIFLPPWFMVSRAAPRRGLVVYVLRKKGSDVHRTSFGEAA